MTAKLVAFLLCPLAVWVAWTTPAAIAADFDRRPLPLAGDKLFDMGVVDFDLDGDLDSFTLNHRYTQTLLANDGSGRWHDVFHQTELQPTPPFPGLEALHHPPAEDQQGAYLYYKSVATDTEGGEAKLHIDNTSSTRVLRGDLGTLVPIDIRRVTNGTADVMDVPGDPPRFRLDFQVDPGGSVVVKTAVMVSPFTVNADLEFPRQSIFVGGDAVNPTSNEFPLRLADRHGMAWGDYDSDEEVDVFISSGGAKGIIRRFPYAFADELRLRRGPVFAGATADSGLDKGLCRGRSTSTIDFNGDDVLDLLESCVGSHPRLWAGNGDGTFADASGLRGKGSRGEIHRWADLNGDHRPDLVAADPDRLALLTQGDQGFATRRVFRVRGAPRGVTIGDWDGNRWPDILATYSGETALISGHKHRLKRVGLTQVGLPAGGAQAGALVDYNNDGLLDVHLSPQGLFRQRHRGDFVETELGTGGPDASKGFVSWADVNGDGARDLLQYQRTGNGTKAFELINRGASGDWLEVDLVGSEANGQAVGAEVTVRAGKRRHVQWVGQNETSRYSQGHYRLYYGFGNRRKPVAVNVRWPDGATTHLADVAVNRRITIAR